MSKVEFESYKIALSTNLRRLRVQRGLRAEDLALALGMSVRNYYRFESTGKNGVSPGCEILPVLASFYKVTIDELYGLSLPKSALTDQEAVILGYFRKFSEDLRRSFILLAGSLRIQRTSAAKIDKISDLIRLMS